MLETLTRCLRHITLSDLVKAKKIGQKGVCHHQLSAGAARLSSVVCWCCPSVLTHLQLRYCFTVFFFCQEKRHVALSKPVDMSQIEHGMLQSTKAVKVLYACSRSSSSLIGREVLTLSCARAKILDTRYRNVSSLHPLFLSPLSLFLSFSLSLSIYLSRPYLTVIVNKRKSPCHFNHLSSAHLCLKQKLHKNRTKIKYEVYVQCTTLFQLIWWPQTCVINSAGNKILQSLPPAALPVDI